MKNIHVIPTNKPSRLVYNSTTKKLDLYSGNVHSSQCKNIYITNSDKIEKRDWYFDSYHNMVFQAITEDDYNVIHKKKIILKTDQDLIKDGVQSIDDEFLEWICKNPSCEEVAIERWTDYKLKNNEEVIFFNYKIIIPKEEPKQEILEEAKQMMVTQEDILEQIALTEARGEKIVKYLNKYKGDSIYNEIALAIEFGYQLKLEEDEK